MQDLDQQAHCFVMQVSPCKTWMLCQEDMDFIFRMHPDIMDRLLESFKHSLSKHMDTHSHLYRDDAW